MLNDNIKALRKAKGLSQEELAIDSVSAVMPTAISAFGAIAIHD